MDRFLTFEGRQPIWLDDFNFMQDAVESDIKKLVDSLLEALDYDGTSAVILSGCKTSSEYSATSTYTEGVIYSNGKLLKVKQSTVSNRNNLPGSYLTFTVNKEYDTAGDRTMIDSGEEKSCYEKPVAALTRTNSGPHLVRLMNLIRRKYGEKLLYEGTLDGFKFRLVRKDETYFLSGRFATEGGPFTKTFTVVDEEMRQEVRFLVPEQFLSSGETIGIAGYRSNRGQGSAVVYVTVKPGTAENAVDVTVSIPSTLPEAAQGSFSMILKTRI